MFHGSDQYGEGLGDILRGVFRFLLPIATSAASKFITNTSSGLDSGYSLGHAAKVAFLPTLGETVLNVAKEGLARARGMDSAETQMTGKGHKGRKRRRVSKKRSSRKSKSNKVAGQKKQRKRKRVYKGKSTKAKRIRLLSTNF